MKRAGWFISGILIIILYGSFNPDQYFFPKCPFHWMTGWLCPGCGSQRALYQVLHGHFMSAMKLNLLFLPGILYALTGSVISFFFPEFWPHVRRSFYGLKAAYIALVIILVFWLGRNII
ncbi:MAG: DUF2752 domain-containing protein [Saprospiraceae bacterium]